MREHCDAQDSDRGPEDAGELIILCERASLSYEAIARGLYRFEHGEYESSSLTFNDADKLLCGMRRWDAWYGELSEYYQAVDLTWRTCACPGCEREFQPGVDAIGRPKHTIYCSSGCRHAAFKIAHGTHTKRMSVSKRDPRIWCRNGHDKRKVGVDKRGTCKECLRIDRQRYCRRGHLMTPENTIITSNGHSEKTRCRRCFNEKRRKLPVAAAA